MTNLGIDDQEGDHPVLLQVGVSALSVSRLHLVGALQMLQRHGGDVDPPVETKHTHRGAPVAATPASNTHPPLASALTWHSLLVRLSVPICFPRRLSTKEESSHQQH